MQKHAKTAPPIGELEDHNKTQQLKDIETIIKVVRKSGKEPLEAEAMANVLLELSKGLKIE